MTYCQYVVWSCFCHVHFLVLSKTVNCSHFWFVFPPVHPGVLFAAIGWAWSVRSGRAPFVCPNAGTILWRSGCRADGSPERCEDIFFETPGRLTACSEVAADPSKAQAGNHIYIRS